MKKDRKQPAVRTLGIFGALFRSAWSLRCAWRGAALSRAGQGQDMNGGDHGSRPWQTSSLSEPLSPQLPKGQLSLGRGDEPTLGLAARCSGDIRGRKGPHGQGRCKHTACERPQGPGPATRIPGISPAVGLFGVLGLRGARASWGPRTHSWRPRNRKMCL